MTAKLYLAYGANTNFSNMSGRCPAARYICNVTLSHHQLVFRGVADVVAKRGARVTCALWLISEKCEQALDRFEGFPHLYVKKYVTLHLNEKRHRVMLYVMRSRREQYPPSTSYEHCLRTGYADCGISTKQIDNAIARSTAWKPRSDGSAAPLPEAAAAATANRLIDWARSQQDELEIVPPSKHFEAPSWLKAHPLWDSLDYGSLRRKGYSDTDIKLVWDSDNAGNDDREEVAP